MAGGKRSRVSIVEQVAPPLPHGGLNWLADVAVKGYAIPGAYYRYQDTAVRRVVGPWLQRLWASGSTSRAPSRRPVARPTPC
jgi:hypothetical protein